MAIRGDQLTIRGDPERYMAGEGDHGHPERSSHSSGIPCGHEKPNELNVTYGGS